jgi:hypothetical protein
MAQPEYTRFSVDDSKGADVLSALRAKRIQIVSERHVGRRQVVVVLVAASRKAQRIIETHDRNWISTQVTSPTAG